MKFGIRPSAIENPLFTGRELWVLIWPLLVEQFLSVLVGAADTMMVSRAGEAAISGVSLVDMINVLVLNVFTALATGGAVVVSQYIGAKNKERAELSASQLVLLSGLLGLAVGAVCFFLATPLLGLIYAGVGEDVFEACYIYLRITAISFPFLALYNAGAAIFRSIGNSRISMLVSTLMNIINIIGNAICIFIFNMGVAGVAWPSVISRAIAAVLILYLASDSKNMISLKLHEIDHFNIPLAKRILNIGIPSGFENSLFQLGRIVVVNMITYAGIVHISANAVANNIDKLFIVPGNAMGMAMITVVGRCVGAQDEKQTVFYSKLITFYGYVALWISGAIVNIFLVRILGLYEISPETARLSEFLIRFHSCFGMLLWPISFVLPNALRAAGDVRFSLIVSVASMMIWRVSLSYVLAYNMGMGAVGVWIAMIVDWICRVICFVARFVSGAWKTKYVAG